MVRKVLIIITAFLLLIGVLIVGASTVRNPLPKKARANRVIIEKEARRLTIISDGQSLKTYRIALGRNPVGPKVKRGDGKTPEGLYVIDYRNPNGKYHLSLHISYPSKKDIEYAKELGVSSGGDIMIHGLPNGLGWIGWFHRLADWTKGCIAVSNSEIEELWNTIPDGTPIEIRSWHDKCCLTSG